MWQPEVSSFLRYLRSYLACRVRLSYACFVIYTVRQRRNVYNNKMIYAVAAQCALSLSSSALFLI